jgi:hypothetical protein
MSEKCELMVVVLLSLGVNLDIGYYLLIRLFY